jgi:hypothetical protein
MLVDYNGNPQMKKIITELADGFLAHRRNGVSGRASLSMAIRFSDDQEVPTIAAVSCRFYGRHGSGPVTKSTWRPSGKRARAPLI